MRSVVRSLVKITVIRRSSVAIALGLTVLAVTGPTASAINAGPAGVLGYQIKQESSVIDVVVRRGGGAVRRTTVVGPRGGVASRTVVRRGAVVRPGYAGGGVRWARPGRYYWPRGGAIAAGAAIGFVTAATAAAWAGAAPAPGMCWYYTDPSRTQGFWDYCR
ncbi:hypothetical protein ABIB00_002671 [Bradyrhizobium sp. LB14.3]|jgi:hypothetical protein|uniref:hypothetical protein n=1 Tax=Bradyrhizobium sp. LB14.3 TaxID=3156328 RepID=UPI00339529C9